MKLKVLARTDLRSPHAATFGSARLAKFDVIMEDALTGSYRRNRPLFRSLVKPGMGK